MSTRARWTTRTLAGLAAAGVSVLMTAGPAAAHARVERTTPGNGATVDGRLKVISVVFDDPVEVVPRSLVVTGSTGAPQTIGAPHVVGKHILQAALSDRLPAGRYLVGWRILSDDGHIESGSFGFTVTLAGGAPATRAGVSAGMPPAPGQPTWPVVVAAVMAAAACLGAALVVVRGLAAVRTASVVNLDETAVGLDQYPDERVVVIPASEGRHSTSRH